MYLAEDLQDLEPLRQADSILTTVVPMLTWGCGVLGAIAVMVGAFKLATAHRDGHPSGGVGAILGGGIVVGASVIFNFLPGIASSDSPAPDNEPPAAAPEPPQPIPSAAPIEDPSAPGADFDGDPMNLLVALGAVGAVVVIGYVGFHLYDSIAARRHTARERAYDWKKAQGVYAEVLSEFAAYQADPYAWLQRPLLESNTEPATVAFIDALATARDLDLETMPRNPERITAFREAANEALRTWTAADANARLAVDRDFTPEDRRKLRRAEDVMRLAVDNRTPAGERSAALTKVRDLTNGLVAVPDRIFTPVTAAIETSHRKALPMGTA
jgi:hypothetical protein